MEALARIQLRLVPGIRVVLPKYVRLALYGIQNFHWRLGPVKFIHGTTTLGRTGCFAAAHSFIPVLSRPLQTYRPILAQNLPPSFEAT